MSWDVYIFDAPSHVTSIDDIPQDFEPRALGAATDTRQRLRDRLPDLDLTDPAWGHLAGLTWSIEFNIGADDPVISIMLHVRGSGGDVIPVIAQIVAAVGWRALDISTGEFLTDDPTQTAGWHAFQQYRDQVLHHG